MRDIPTAMPEALAVFAVVVVSIAAWFGAWMHTRNPANYKPHDEIARLQQRAAWLGPRIEVAQRERWGDDMMAALLDERSETVEQLALCREQGRRSGKQNDL
jgi:hypothetical protein